MDEPLVRAMSRRPLYGWRGLATRVDLGVLQAVEQGWYATRAAIAADVDCKEVRVAVAVAREGRLLVADGRAVHLAEVDSEHAGLVGLKRLARRRAEALCAAGIRGVELGGYWHDDQHPELRRVFLLVYRAAPAAEPPGAIWAAPAELPDDPLAAPLAPALIPA